MNKMYSYFVSYSFTALSTLKSGNGRCNVSIDAPIRNTDDLEYIENLLKKQNGFDMVTIINWRKWDSEDDPTN